MKRLSLLLLAAFAAPLVQAADLDEIYREAQSRDAAFASARAAYKASQEKLPQGRALLLPSINLTANTNYNDVDSHIHGGASTNPTYSSHGYAVSLSQPVYRKQNQVQYEEAKLQVAQAASQLNIAQQDLILRVAQAYFDELLAQDSVAFAAAQKTAIAEQLAQAKRNFEVGTTTITDTHEAQAKYDLVTAQEIAALNDLEVKKHALQKIIGKIPGKLNGLGEKMPLQLPEPNDMDKWVATSEQQNLQLQIQRSALELAQQEVERNRGARHPTLDLVASYTDSNQGNSTQGYGSDSQTKVIGLQLAMPLYQGGALSSKISEALANKEKAVQDLEESQRQIALQTRQTFLGVTSGVAQVKALEQALVSSQSSLDSTKLGFEVGVRTSVDVLNAQQQLFSAKRDLAQARYNYILSQLKLRAAAGTLSDGDVTQVNGWLGK
jgi:outer membrane protein